MYVLKLTHGYTRLRHLHSGSNHSLQTDGEYTDGWNTRNRYTSHHPAKCSHSRNHTYIHTHTHTQMQNSANYLTTLAAPCAPGRARMPVHYICRHYEPCMQSSWSRARNSQENRPFFTASGVGTEVLPGPLLFYEKRLWNCIPANARYPITAGWTGGRQMENQMEKFPELGLKIGTSGPEPRTQPLHHTHAPGRARMHTQPPHTHSFATYKI